MDRGDAWDPEGLPDETGRDCAPDTPTSRSRHRSTGFGPRTRSCAAPGGFGADHGCSDVRRLSWRSLTSSGGWAWLALGELRDLLIVSTPATRKWAAARAFLLVDLNFRDPAWWEAVHRRPADPRTSAPGAALFRAPEPYSWCGRRCSLPGASFAQRRRMPGCSSG